MKNRSRFEISRQPRSSAPRALSTWFAATVLSMLAALITGCGSGFETAKSISSCLGTNCSGNSSTGGTGGGTPGDSGSSREIAMDGSINGGRFDRTKVVEIDLPGKMLVIRMPFIAGLALGAQAMAPIRDLPGASIGLETNADGTSALVLRLPLEHALRGVSSLPKGRLPNGDALPAVPDGELPTLGLSVERSGTLRGALYVGPTVVGLFITTKFDPFIRLTLPIRNQARTETYGYFSTIPAKGNFDGGFFLSIALPPDLARAIDDMM